jgi:SOS-response transcriptional repressor LexA
MDVNWFKQQQKLRGVTADDIAQIAGRNRTNVSHIYNGKQRMSLDWANAFAKALDVPVSLILTKAGEIDGNNETETRGFAENDAAPFQIPPQNIKESTLADHLGAGRAGVDIWTVNSATLVSEGYLPGDRILVDTNQADRCRAGDIVIAQVYNGQTGTAETILRRYEPPVLIAPAATAGNRVLIVDNNNVIIRGRVVGSWRAITN